MRVENLLRGRTEREKFVGENDRTEIERLKNSVKE